MRIENIEIFSDRSNMAVMRHPGRSFPGLLVQGDTLHTLCTQAADALSGGPDSLEELQDLHSKLLEMLSHYKSVLNQHQIDLPFREASDA
ncbi:hypothetical protein D3C81_476510 [compost metagenome]